MGTPNINLLLGALWAGGDECAANPYATLLGGASNIVIGSNPPWSAADFFAFYPKFGGTPIVLSGNLVGGSPIISNITSDASIRAGQLIAGPGIASGTAILSVDGVAKTVTLTQGTTATLTASQVTVYVAPIVPLPVINGYIAVASASIMQARWKATWAMAVGLYCAHFCTLWLQSDGDEYCTKGQAAAAGLAQGIAVSQSAGPVSISMQVTPGLDEFGAWNETQYGKQLCTFARSMGAGPVLCW